MERRVLIGSCGGLTGVYLTKMIKQKEKDVVIFGIDSVSSYASRKYIDSFFLAPKFGKEYIDFLIKIINDYKIDYYFPTHSKETKLISENEEFLHSNSKVKFIVSSYETFEKLNNKRDAYLNLNKIGLNTPEIYERESTVKFPAFIKPFIGSGSRDTFILDDINDYNFFTKKEKNSFVLEYINGEEYTVDAIFDNNGELVSYNQRIRMKQLGGATICTQNMFDDYDAIEDLLLLQKHFVFKGVVNFQFILKEGKAYYIDINLRYASGGLPLSVESGVDIIEILFDILDNKTIGKEKYQSDRKKRTMYRYFEELFEVE